jgi:hypothetical protein
MLQSSGRLCRTCRYTKAAIEMLRFGIIDLCRWIVGTAPKFSVPVQQAP